MNEPGSGEIPDPAAVRAALDQLSAGEHDAAMQAMGVTPPTDGEESLAMAGEGARENINEAMLEIERGRTDLALRLGDPTMDAKTRSAWEIVLESTKDSVKTLPDPVKDSMIAKWKEAKIPQGDAREFILNSTELDPGEKADMLSRISTELEEAEAHEDDNEELSPEEQARMESRLEAMEDGLTSMENDLKNVDVEALSDEERLKLEHAQTKVEVLSQRLHKFLHPDDGVKRWAIRGGKFTGYTIFAAFMALVLYLHLFHNAAKKQ